MATLALSLAGQVVGGAIGGPFGATVGRALGALAGAGIDNALFGDGPGQAQHADIRLTGSSEGGAIPRLYGWSRLAGNVVWASELEELTSEASGGKGTATASDNDRTIAASFAVAFCEGEVHRLGRVWADGRVLDTSALNVRFYRGTQTQLPDSLIEAVQGVGNAPAYRGLCYLVFERLALAPFGNRIPSISVELCRVVGELEPQIRTVNIIPSAGEFIYDPAPRVRIVSAGVTEGENTHVSAEVSDWTMSIDELVALCPNLERVSLVISWFGDDLRCSHCTIAPRTEGTSRAIAGTTWSVAGLARHEAPVSSLHDGKLAYGGTPSDNAVLAAITDLKARGLDVVLYPLIMMDIPSGNPMGQPAYPWRGRISCDPPPGAEGSPDGTATAAAQVADFLPSYRDFVLHHAGLAVAAGGVDALIIGSEMKALTAVRGADDSFPFVAALVELAAEVRAIVGPDCQLTYAADWSEVTGTSPGGGAKYFHLDPLWASPDIDAIGIDNYMPIADWRDGTDHADADIWGSSYDLDYLAANIAGGEGFAWYYADEAARRAGERSAIADGAGEPWIWRFKDLVSWWGEPHHDRPGGTRSETPTAWVPASKPIWFTELGCGAIDKGANQPSAFADAKSIENTLPFFSTGAPDALMQRQYLRAQYRHWTEAANNPVSAVYGGPMLDVARMAPWAWDARPFPAFPTAREAWGDWPNYATGHWLNGRLGGIAVDEFVQAIAADYGVSVARVEVAGPLVHGYTVEGVTSARDALAPVLSIVGVDVFDTPDGLSFALPPSRPAATILRDDLAETDAPFVSRRRPDPSGAVGQLTFTHLDRERGYLASTVVARALGGGGSVTERAPLVLDAQGARYAAERLLGQRAAAIDTLELAVPHTLLALEPGDAVALAGQGEGPFEVTAIRDGAVRRLSARALAPRLELAAVSDASRVGSSVAIARALPVVVAGHLPPDPDTPGAPSRLMLAAFATPWPGEVIVRHADTGAQLAGLERPATIGTLLEPLLPGPLARWDRANGALVELHRGHLAAVPDHGVLAGANRIVVEHDDGGWEILGFASATLVAPGTYRLERLLRGQIGSDPAMAGASAGSRVVVLDGAVALVDATVTWLGGAASLSFHAGPQDIAGTALAPELDLGPVLPLRPVHLRCERLAGGDIALRWTRRSRWDGDGWGMAESPLDAAPEAYRVTIAVGGEVLRTLTSGVPEVTYTLVAQTADFGGPAPGFTVHVAQISPVFGPGHAGGLSFDG